MKKLIIIALLLIGTLYPQEGSAVSSQGSSDNIANTIVRRDASGDFVTENVTIDGNVGIGRTSPGSQLHIESDGTGAQITVTGKTDATADARLLLSATGATSVQGIQMRYERDTAYGYIENLYNNDAGNIYIRTKTAGTPVNALTILGTGLVGLSEGTTINEFSVDGTLTGDSDDAVPTEKAVKKYVDDNAGGITVSGNNNEMLTDDGASGIVSESELLYDGTDLQLGVSIDDVRPIFSIVGDADSDVGDDVSETFSITLDPKETSTNSVWEFKSTGSAGYSFDKDLFVENIETTTGTEFSSVLDYTYISDNDIKIQADRIEFIYQSDVLTGMLAAFEFSYPGTNWELVGTDEQAIMSIKGRVNKESGGNYIGILFDVLETNITGVNDELMALRVDGADKFTISNSGDVAFEGTLTIGTTYYGEMGNVHDLDATEVLAEADQEYAMYHANITGSAPHLNSGFSFVAGSNGVIASANTDAGTVVTFTDNDHGLLADDYITLNGMSDVSYNGVYKVQSVTTHTFTITETNTTSTETGFWQMGSYLLVGNTGTNRGAWNASVAMSLNTKTLMEISPYVNTTRSTKACAEFQLTNTGDSTTIGGNGIMTFTAGDRIWFAAESAGAANTLTFHVRNITIH